MKRFDRKILAGILIIMLVILPVLGGGIFSLLRVAADQNELLSSDMQDMLRARDLSTQKTHQMALMPIYVLTGDKTILNNLDIANQRFTLTLGELEKHATPEELAMLHAIRALQERDLAVAKPGIALRAAGGTVEQVNAYFNTQSGGPTNEVVKAINEFVAHTTFDFNREKYNTLRLTHNVIKIMGIASALAIFICLVAGGLLIHIVRQKKRADDTLDRLTQKERQLSEARKEAVEVVAHDLKNPLSGMIMSMELARRRWRAKAGNEQVNEEVSPMLDIALDSADVMKRLIDDLLDHAKIEAGAFTLTRAPQDIGLILKHVAMRLEPLAKQKGIRLHSDVPAGLPLASVDTGRVEQVVSNLLSNAIKFTPQNGQITVKAQQGDGEIILSIADTGPGMSAEQVAHIFERYWQVRATASKGTGLGLAIAKSIVAAHNGRIWVDSVQGKGTIFFVALPCREAKAVLGSPVFAMSAQA